MAYVEITDEKQFNELLQKHDHVIVDFYASWCGPCKTMSEEFAPIKQEHPNVAILKVNIDEEDLENIVEKHGVSSLPHVFYYHKNTQVSSFIGNNKAKLWDMAKKSSA